MFKKRETKLTVVISEESLFATFIQNAKLRVFEAVEDSCHGLLISCSHMLGYLAAFIMNVVKMEVA